LCSGQPQPLEIIRVPTIFDNIETVLLSTLRDNLRDSLNADFAVGYFRMSGWSHLADSMEHFEGTDSSCCRILVGMNKTPQEETREEQSIRPRPILDGPTMARIRHKAAQSFREQIEYGLPTATTEASLRQLARQLRAHKVRVKLYLGGSLHAKLYLIRRADRVTPLIGYVGSSNLSYSGLSGQGELTIDVVEQDAARKLQYWFNDRWDDELHSFDISDDLAELIETSWASERPVLPYHVYLKMAYHLSEEARQGEREFKLPEEFRGVLLDFQERAVSLAAHHLNQRKGVLLGDVVGLGKTLMATAIAKIFEEDTRGGRALIICPPKLVSMWEWHVGRFNLKAQVLSLGQVSQLENEFPVRLVVIDESHNLRNREGKRYINIRDFIDRWDPAPRVLLLTATPYNKQFTDLSAQLRLFLDESQDLRVRPELFFQWWASRGFNESDFIARFQASPRSIRAFEQSPYPDDWRDLMRLYLVRRTRSFIMRNYAHYDETRDRYYVTLNGQPSYFPLRQPHTVTFPLSDGDQYERLYNEHAVTIIEDLSLPRYGLTNYLAKNVEQHATPTQKTVLDNLNRAGRRLLGFHRTNLFKRLESSGLSFLLSLDHHIARNMVALYALQNGLDLPIGPQDAALLDTAITDSGEEFANEDETAVTTGDIDPLEAEPVTYSFPSGMAGYENHAAQLYALYSTTFRRRFSWLPASFFTKHLTANLVADTTSLLSLLSTSSNWRSALDTKLDALYALLTADHPSEKVIIFTQFADTALYLTSELQARGLRSLACATGSSADPTALARRFSPSSNGGLRPGETELRVLVATDVLAEGQNLQDAHIIVNYDLPWAIIRLIQRAGRVDRIGQKHDTIDVYSFLPAERLDEIIKLRSRLFHRLQTNQEVIGTDESFFGEDAAEKLRDLYTGRTSALDDDTSDADVDLASMALQVWNSATTTDRKIVEKMPPVVSASRSIPTSTQTGALTGPAGMMTYLRFQDGTEATDSIVRVDAQGNLFSQSVSAAFRAAACAPDEPPSTPAPNHYDLIAAASTFAVQEQTSLGGQLGSLRSTRRKVYERLKLYRETVQRRSPMFSTEKLAPLDPAFTAIMRYPLKEPARDSLGRQLRLGIRDDDLVQTVIDLHAEDRLCVIKEDEPEPEPQIVCSLGFVRPRT
jgi:superfamily II DNA or RNA helicase